MAKKLIIIGGHGNGTIALWAAEGINAVSKEWEVLGFLNDRETEPIFGYPILGKIDRETIAKYLPDKDVYFFYTLISVKLNHNFLHKLYDLEIPMERFATLIHPTAVISEHAKIGRNVFIQSFVTVGPGAEIDDFVMIHPHAIIGRDTKLNNFSYIAANVCIGAEVYLEEGAYVGLTATIIEFTRLGKWSLTGIGSVVIKDVEPFTKVVGNPARVIGKVE